MAVDGHTLLVVIPAYRAADSIQDLVRRIPAYVDWIVVVDDASPDDLVERVTCIEDPRLILLRHERNLGVGAATVTGFREALRRKARFIAKIDADGQMDPTFLDRFVRISYQHGCDYVKGNRFGHLEALQSMPRARFLGSIILTFMTKIVSGYWNVFDPQNGYILISRRMLRLLNLDKIDRGYTFENSMLVNLNILRARLGEIYLPASYGSEISSLKVTRAIITFPYFLIKGLLYRIYQKYVFRSLSPLVLLLGFGITAMVWGAIFGGMAWYRSLTTGVAAPTGTVVLALLPLLLGWTSILHAVVLDVQDAGPCLLFEADDDSLLAEGSRQQEQVRRSHCSEEGHAG